MKEPICCDCGEHKPDMVSEQAYVGGIGYVMVYECEECREKRLRDSTRGVNILRKVMEGK